MSFFIGLDIGGTKIASIVLDASGQVHAERKVTTPTAYADLLRACKTIVEDFHPYGGNSSPVGVGVPGAIQFDSAGVLLSGNIPCLSDQPFHRDLEKMLNRSVRFANDANCAALSEAMDGAGRGFETVFGLILGTGVGGGYVINDHLIVGANGIAGEFAHTPLPFRDSADGPLEKCVCGLDNCIEKATNGAALARCYKIITGKEANAPQIAELARLNDSGAAQALDRYYTTLAKGLAVVLHTFDPHVIVVSGGLSQLPGLYDIVPQRWGKYSVCAQPQTTLVQAKHGPMTGVRGAAWLWKLAKQPGR